MRQQYSRRWWTTLGRVCCLVMIVLASGEVLAPGVAMAQNQPEEAAEDAAQPAEETAAPAADSPAPTAASTGAEDSSTAETEGTARPQQNLLQWVYKSLGLFYLSVFLLLSFTLVALFVMNLMTARRESVCPLHLVEGFEAHLNQKKYQEAYEMAKGDESFLGQVLSAGLAKLSTGYSQAIEAMQEVGEEENMKLEHRLSYMALIGTISPMVGLFGTVDGMIRAFMVIANSTSAPKPSELAEGISTALLTTLIGLAIAIPAIVVYNLLKNRVARLVLEVGILSEGLMSRFQNVGAGKQ